MALQPSSPNFSNRTTENPLDEEKKLGKGDTISRVYTPEDRDYCSFLQIRLEDAKRQKQQPYPEFGWKTYYQVYQENEAMTVI